ncbi:unnamed protein product [Prunus brigantina]
MAALGLIVGMGGVCLFGIDRDCEFDLPFVKIQIHRRR